jgi:hypothetical protein
MDSFQKGIFRLVQGGGKKDHGGKNDKVGQEAAINGKKPKLPLSK